MPVPFCQLITVSAQGFANLGRFDLTNAIGTAEVSLTLVAHPSGQVARARIAMLDLARRRNAKAFLGSLVGFLLRHD